MSNDSDNDENDLKQFNLFMISKKTINKIEKKYGKSWDVFYKEIKDECYVAEIEEDTNSSSDSDCCCFFESRYIQQSTRLFPRAKYEMLAFLCKYMKVFINNKEYTSEKLNYLSRAYFKTNK